MSSADNNKQPITARNLKRLQFNVFPDPSKDIYWLNSSTVKYKHETQEKASLPPLQAKPTKKSNYISIRNIPSAHISPLNEFENKLPFLHGQYWNHTKRNKVSQLNISQTIDSNPIKLKGLQFLLQGIVKKKKPYHQ